MRLTKQQTNTIQQTVSRLAGIGATVYLFASRLNDQARGGDIELLIESDTQLSLLQRLQVIYCAHDKVHGSLVFYLAFKISFFTGRYRRVKYLIDTIFKQQHIVRKKLFA